MNQTTPLSFKTLDARAFFDAVEQDLDPVGFENASAYPRKLEDRELGLAEALRQMRNDHPVVEDLAVVSFGLENVMSDPGPLLGYHQLPNGLTFWGSSAGDDAEFPVHFILYVDEKDQVRGYVPQRGNAFDPTTMAAHIAGEGGIADDASELPTALQSNPEAMMEDILEAFGLQAPSPSTPTSKRRSP